MFVLLKEKYRMGNILDEAWDKRQQFSEVVCQLKNYNLPIDVRSVMEGIFAINV